MTTRADIVDEARTWLGTPYLHLAREKGRFTDCVGMIIGIARQFELGDYTKKDYSAIPDPEHMGRELYRALNVIPLLQAAPGDILWFALVHPRTREKIPRHLGIISDYHLGGRGIIHAYKEVGRVTEHRLDGRWARRIYKAFSYRGLEN